MCVAGQLARVALPQLTCDRQWAVSWRAPGRQLTHVRRPAHLVACIGHLRFVGQVTCTCQLRLNGSSPGSVSSRAPVTAHARAPDSSRTPVSSRTSQLMRAGSRAPVSSRRGPIIPPAQWVLLGLLARCAWASAAAAAGVAVPPPACPAETEGAVGEFLAKCAVCSLSEPKHAPM
jgi:hypothetical protein